MTIHIGIERNSKELDRFRRNKDKNTVDKLCKETGEFKHYKTFDELTLKELKKCNKFWVYNLKI